MKQFTRRTILAAAPGALAFGAPSWPLGRRAPRRIMARASPTPRSRSATPVPIAARPRPTARSPKSQAAYLEDDQRSGRHKRAQDQLHLLRRCLYAAEDRRNGAQARRAGSGPVDRQPARHPDQQRDLALHEPAQGAAAVRRHRRHQMGRPEGPSLDDRLAAELSERRPHLCLLHPQGKAGRQDRRALPERRFRQGLSEGGHRRARRQGRRR